MSYTNNISITILIISLFLLSSTDAISESDMHHDIDEKQHVQKLESGRKNLLKRDTDPEGKTEENKENIDTNVPRGAGVQYPPAAESEPPFKKPGN